MPTPKRGRRWLWITIVALVAVVVLVAALFTVNETHSFSGSGTIRHLVEGWYSFDPPAGALVSLHWWIVAAPLPRLQMFVEASNLAFVCSTNSTSGFFQYPSVDPPYALVWLSALNGTATIRVFGNYTGALL